MRIVLVHGSWHTGELWGPVAAILRQAGHEVHTPTIAGHGVGVNKRVTHAQCSQSITDYVVANDLNDIVLLGHSYGGTIISKVVEAIPDRVRRLVFWNAFVLNDGESLNDNVPPPYRALFESMSQGSPDGSVMMPFRSGARPSSTMRTWPPPSAPMRSCRLSRTSPSSRYNCVMAAPLIRCGLEVAIARLRRARAFAELNPAAPGHGVLARQA